MKVQSTYYNYDLTNFSENEIKNLKKEIEKLSFRQVFPGLGGGEATEQIISILTVHREALLLGVTSNILYDIIKKISLNLYKWYKSTKKSKEDFTKKQPIVSIHIHYTNISQVQNINLNLNKEYTEKEVEYILKNTKFYNISEDFYDYEDEIGR